MIHLSIVLALAGLAVAADTTGFSIHQGKIPLPNDVNSLGLHFGVRSDSCRASESSCDSLCIPRGGECCDAGDGSYCEEGKQCVDNGCCPKGVTCSGPPTHCDDGKELCGEYCIPEGSVCCQGQNTYCPSGQTCTDDGCESGDDDGNSGRNETTETSGSNGPTPSSSPTSSPTSTEPSSSSDNDSATSDTDSNTTQEPTTTEEPTTTDESTSTEEAPSEDPTTTDDVTSDTPPETTEDSSPETTEDSSPETTEDSSPETTEDSSPETIPGEETTINETITEDTGSDTDAPPAATSDTFIDQTTLDASHVTAVTTVLPSDGPQPTDFITGDDTGGAGFVNGPSSLAVLLVLLPLIL